jgi:hypothetical protein
MIAPPWARPDWMADLAAATPEVRDPPLAIQLGLLRLPASHGGRCLSFETARGLRQSGLGERVATVRAHPGQLSALSVSYSKSGLYGGFVWARRAA